MRKARVLLGLWLFAAGGLALRPSVAAAAEGSAPARATDVKGVSVSLQSADLKAVVTALARAYNINLVGSDKLTGSVTLHLSHAPVHEALEIILKNAGFTLAKKKNGIYEILTAAQAARVKLAAQVPHVKVFVLKFADVARAARLLVPSAIPESKNISKDSHSSRLIISGTDEQFSKVEQILKEIDRPVRQVAIRARIVEVYVDRAKSLGMSLDVIMKSDSVLGDDGTGTLTFDLTQTPVAANAFGFAFVSRRIDVALSALVQKEVAEVLSAPRITTAHGCAAEIKVVNQVPVITRTTRIVDGVTVTDENVSFKETGLTLTVTPRVLADRQIEMVVEPVVQELTGWTDTDPPAPIIDTRSAKTTVTISDGRWLVIGGLMRYNERTLHRGIPLLKDLPLIGWLFRSTYTTREQSNLIILVSATVLDGPAAEREVKGVRADLQKHRKDHNMKGSPFPLEGDGAGGPAGKGEGK